MTMARPKPSPDLDARDRILAAAGEIFAAVGFAGARIDDIAARAGINKAMLYYHVGDKERLYAAVLTDSIEKALAALHQAIDKVPKPSDKLQAILETFAAFGSTSPFFVPIMLREIASGGRSLPDEMLMRMASVFRVVADVLADGVTKGAFRRTDPLLTHVSLVGSMIFLIASQPVRERVSRIAGVPGANQSAGDLAHHTANLFLHGLETAPSRAQRSTRRGSKS
jgi:AcrR family transcriptional regulator